MICHEHDEPSKVDKDKCEEYEEETMMPENHTKDFRQVEIDIKPNLGETEIVNLGDEE